MALDLSPSDPMVAFGGFALLVFVGFLGNLAFAYLRFNDTLILMALGVLIGPVFHWIEPSAAAPIAAVAGPLALILILFDGGLALKFKDLLHGVGPAFALALLGFAFTVGAVATVLVMQANTPWLSALAFGAVVGGTSSVIVMSSLAYIRCKPKTATTLALESALTDIFVVVGVFALATAGGAAALASGVGGFDAGGMAAKMGILFGASLAIGAAAGFLWLLVVPAVRDHPFGYMLTLGTAFTVYLLAEWAIGAVSGGGGPLAVLAFGIVLGNATGLGKWFKEHAGEDFGKGLKRFQGELSFLVRTFFFIQLGILVDPTLLDDADVVATGLMLFGALALARYLAVGFTVRNPVLGREGWVMLLMMPRGLAAAVMAGVPLAAGMPGADRFVAYAFILVGLTNLVSTFGGFVLGGKSLENQPPEGVVFVRRTPLIDARRRPSKPQS
jgi:potassium/hydrogen antiporter